MANDIDEALGDDLSDLVAGSGGPNPNLTVLGNGVRRFQGFLIPASAQRVKVIDDKGSTRLRKIDDLRATDTLSLNDSGLPVFVEGQIGKPPVTKKTDTAMPPASPIIGDILKIKQGMLRNDPIIQAAETTPESAEVLNQVLLGISEEAASLRFERMEAERNGEDTSQLSMRRVQALKAIGDTWIKRKEQIAHRGIDLESPSFRAVFEYISETFARAMQNSGARQELIDSVMAQFSKLLDDAWMSEAKTRMKE
jgi:D-ribose pyranose/furanose isomerase RbsD